VLQGALSHLAHHRRPQRRGLERAHRAQRVDRSRPQDGAVRGDPFALDVPDRSRRGRTRSQRAPPTRPHGDASLARPGQERARRLGLGDGRRVSEAARGVLRPSLSLRQARPRRGARLRSRRHGERWSGLLPRNAPVVPRSR
jgi:hypothetical protein